MMDKVDCAVNSVVEYSETVGTEERKPTTRARTHSEIRKPTTKLQMEPTAL